MDTSSGSIRVARLENNILHIALKRPEALNTLTAEVLRELHDIVRQAKEDERIKALLITGEGKAFCAGADIHQFETLGASDGLAFARRGQLIFRALEQLGKPSLAAIDGYALGGGLELALAATLRIASPIANFGQPEIKLGLIPGFGGTQRLARLIGKGRALDMCLTGKMIDAKNALAYGLITEIVSAEKLIERAKDILSSLTKLPALAMSSIMASIDQGYDLSLTDAFEIEATHFALCCATQDKEEGVKAFLAKRPPHFTGK